MTSCSMPSACGVNGPTGWGVCGRVWRRGWHCTTSASGSTIGSVVRDWPSPTCWDGEPTIHTKRLRAGARGYVLKDADEEELVRAIRAVGRGEAIFSPSVADRAQAIIRAREAGIEQHAAPFGLRLSACQHFSSRRRYLAG